MKLLELAHEANIDPKKVSQTRGGEYHSPCPSCGGRDRFIIWPQQERYWCRQCKVHGDAIQFCRDFLGLSFQESCKKVGRQITEIAHFKNKNKKFTFHPETGKLPLKIWQQKSREFVDACHQRLLVDREAQAIVRARGLSLESIQRFKIGWNPQTRWDRRQEWGLSTILKENGRERKVWLPQGVILPLIEDGVVRKVKIRRHPYQVYDSYPKYVEVAGSSPSPVLLSNQPHLPCVIVESEFDAMLLAQEVGDICNSLVLGGAQKRPDKVLHEKLQRMPKLLFALDFDEAGKNEYRFWRKVYPNLKPWPTPREKSPGDAFVAGVDLRAWVLQGIAR